MRKAVTKAGISFDKSPNGPKPREQSANGKQKGKFAGTVKTKNKANKIAQRSIVPFADRNEVSDSDDDNQPEYGGMATIVKKPKKRHVSPRAMNAMLVGITKRRDPDMQRISGSVDRELGSDERRPNVDQRKFSTGFIWRLCPEGFGVQRCNGPARWCTRRSDSRRFNS